MSYKDAVECLNRRAAWLEKKQASLSATGQKHTYVDAEIGALKKAISLMTQETGKAGVEQES